MEAADILKFLIVLSALGAGLIGGVFFAFSAFIMTAFSQISSAAGTAAMRRINEVILRSWFIPIFVAMPLLCLVLMIWSAFRWNGTHSILIIAGGGIYIVGSFLVTIFFNVPMNDRLDRSEGESSDESAIWQSYIRSWTIWNHVRTISSLIASAMLTASLLFPNSQR